MKALLSGRNIGRNRSTRMTKPGKRTLTGAALPAGVKDANAAMRTKIIRGIGEINRPLATGAYFFGEPGNR